MSFESFQEARESINSLLSEEEPDNNDTLLDEYTTKHGDTFREYLDEIENRDGISFEQKLSLQNSLYDFLRDQIKKSNWEEACYSLEGLKKELETFNGNMEIGYDTEELLNSPFVKGLLKEIMEESRQSVIQAESFYNALVSHGLIPVRKRLDTPLSPTLSSLSNKLGIPISFFHIDEPSKHYSTEELGSIDAWWGEYFNGGLRNNKFYLPLSDKRLHELKNGEYENFESIIKAVLKVPDGEDFRKWLQEGFEKHHVKFDIQATQAAINYKNENETLSNEVLQEKASNFLEKLFANVDPKFHGLLGHISAVNFVPRDGAVLGINLDNFSLIVPIESVLQDDPYNELPTIMEHELVHMKYTLIVAMEQEKKMSPTIDEKITAVLGEEPPKSLSIKLFDDRPEYFFWEEEIPEEIFKMISEDDGNDQKIISITKIKGLSKGEKEKVRSYAVGIPGRRIVPNNGYISPYSTTKYPLEFILNGRIDADGFNLELATVTVQLYETFPDEFINDAYKKDSKIKRLVDEVLIPYGFLPAEAFKNI